MLTWTVSRHSVLQGLSVVAHDRQLTGPPCRPTMQYRRPLRAEFHGPLERGQFLLLQYHQRQRGLLLQLPEFHLRRHRCRKPLHQHRQRQRG